MTQAELQRLVEHACAELHDRKIRERCLQYAMAFNQRASPKKKLSLAEDIYQFITREKDTKH